MHANMYARYLFLIYATNTVLVLYGVKQEKKFLSQKNSREQKFKLFGYFSKIFLTIFKNVDLKLLNVSSFYNYRD